MQEKNPSMKRFALYVSIQVQFTIARFNMRENMVLTDLTGIKINNLRYKKLNWPLISIGDLFFFWGRGENHPTSTRTKNHQSGSNISIFLIYFYFFRNLKKWEKLVFAPNFDRGTFFFWKGGEGHPMSTHAKNHQSESII